MQTQVTGLLPLRENLTMLCRFCLKPLVNSRTKLHIFCEGRRSEDILQKTLNCLSLIISEDDSLPKNICLSCEEKLTDFQDFRDMCHKSESMLIQLLSLTEMSLSSEKPAVVNENKRETQNDVVDVTLERNNYSIKSESNNKPLSTNNENTITHLLAHKDISVAKLQMLKERTTNTVHSSVQFSSPNPSQTILNVGKDVTVSVASERKKKKPVPSSDVNSVSFKKGMVKNMLRKLINDRRYQSDEESGEGFCESLNDKSENQGDTFSYLCSTIHNNNTEGLTSVGDIKQNMLIGSSEETGNVSKIKVENNYDYENCTNMSESNSSDYCSETSRLSRNLDYGPGSTNDNSQSTRVKVVDLVFLSDDSDDDVLPSLNENTGQNIVDLGLSEEDSQLNGKEAKQSAMQSSFGNATEYLSKLSHNDIQTFTNQVGNLDVFLSESDRQRKSDEPFNCPLCNKKLRYKRNLAAHLRIHSGFKPYACKICGRTFTQKISLQDHLHQHTGQKPFVCNVCGRGFPRKCLLNFHYRHQHKR